MQRTLMVADELHSVGFRTKIAAGNAVMVSLSNRKPSRIEVEYALDQLFEGIEFTITSLVDSILLIVE